MLKSQLKIGGIYTALVSGKLVKVKLTAISDEGPKKCRFYCNNLSTNRKLIFKSAARFRREVTPSGPVHQEFISVMDSNKPLDPVDLADTFPPADRSMPYEVEEDDYRQGGATTIPAVKATEVKSSPLSTSLKAAMAPKVATAPHLIIKARAGTGKTTTLVEGLKRVKGMSSRLTPSNQQEIIWQHMCLGTTPRTICFVAFNKSIATELQTRVPQGCEAMTLHSMGFRSVGQAFPKCKVESFRVSNIIAEILETDIRDLRKNKPVLIQATEKLVGLVKMNLADTDPVSLASLASHYEVQTGEDDNGTNYTQEVFSLVPKVIDRCKDVRRDGCVDFNDMIWIPVVLNLPVFKYDLLLVDEAQDLNRCQQALAKRAGTRLILCGDEKQAIYGFAGADATSLPRMLEELQETPVGCLELSLTVTRRCGHAIVKEAQRFVPDFSAHEGNPAGRISEAAYDSKSRMVGNYASYAGVKEAPVSGETYHSRVQAGDMILCRVNAPLVSQCFRFLKEGKKATIQGGDIGDGLISTVNKMKARNLTELVTKLQEWCEKEVGKEMAKKNPNEAKIIATQDRVDCLMCFTESVDTVDGLIAKIKAIFTDDKTAPGIRLSSVHKAKGLEAHRVFILQPEGASMPHPMAKSAWQIEQEYNLLYVAITRAIEELVYVS